MSSEHEPQQSLVDHLTELRNRLIRALLAIAIGAFASWNYSEQIFDFIRQPIMPYLPEGGLVFTGMMDKFMAHLKLSILSGFILTCPIWLYQVWAFVAPGLYKNERGYAVSFLSFGSVLFISGAAFVYFLVYPMAFDYLMNFGGATDKPMITIDSYVSFFFTTTLIFGLAFELPLVLVILAMVGLIDQSFLRKNRRYAIVLLSVICAVITPPDLISMIMLFMPMMLLYEGSIWIIMLISKKNLAEQEKVSS